MFVIALPQLTQMVKIGRANVNMEAMSRDVDGLRKSNSQPADLHNFFRGRFWSTLEALTRHATMYFGNAKAVVAFKQFPLSVIGIERDSHDHIADTFEMALPGLFPQSEDLRAYARGIIDQWRDRNSVAVAPTHIARFVTMECGREMGKRYAAAQQQHQHQ